jgi:hypothetical protein
VPLGWVWLSPNRCLCCRADPGPTCIAATYVVRGVTRQGVANLNGRLAGEASSHDLDTRPVDDVLRTLGLIGADASVFADDGMRGVEGWSCPYGSMEADKRSIRSPLHSAGACNSVSDRYPVVAGSVASRAGRTS